MSQSTAPTTQVSISFLRSLLVLGFLIVTFSAAAQESPQKSSQPSAQPAAVSLDDEIEQLRKRIARLSAEVDRMRAEVARLDKYRQIDYTREQMTKEEDRIRALQKDQVELAAKENPLRKRLDEIEVQQQPDRIERGLAGVGSTKPEEEREAISRRLGMEKRQIQAQLDTIQSSRARNQSFINNAEESIARLKRRLSEISR